MKASDHLSVTGLERYFPPRRGRALPVESAYVVFRLKSGSDRNARVRLDNLNIIALEHSPHRAGLSTPSSDEIEYLANADNALNDPETWGKRFTQFMQGLNALYAEIVHQLGPPQAEEAWEPDSDENMDPRVKRVSRGFFEDMKAYFGERDSQDPDPLYQRKRLKGMSGRIDQQFHDVAELLQEFEEEQYPDRKKAP